MARKDGDSPRFGSRETVVGDVDMAFLYAVQRDSEAARGRPKEPRRPVLAATSFESDFKQLGKAAKLGGMRPLPFLPQHVGEVANPCLEMLQFNIVESVDYLLDIGFSRGGDIDRKPPWQHIPNLQ